MASYVPLWLTQADLELGSNAETVVVCCDTNNSGSPDAAVVLDIIAGAEQEVLSWLIEEYGPAPLSTAVLAQLAADIFLARAARKYALIGMYERHPEYVRASKADDIASRRKEADDLMRRIVNATQTAPTVPTQPANVGGVVVDGASRIYIPNPNDPNTRGGSNAGDY